MAWTFRIDASQPSSYIGGARLINHSKQPNLKLQLLAVDQVPHIILTALVDIAPHTELVCDYGDEDLDSLGEFPWLAGSGRAQAGSGS